MQLLHRKSLLILQRNWIWCGTIRAAMPVLKKRIVRTLIEEVVADVDSDASEVILVIHWKGGLHTQVRVPRRRRGYNNGHTDKELVEAVPCSPTSVTTSSLPVSSMAMDTEPGEATDGQRKE